MIEKMPGKERTAALISSHSDIVEGISELVRVDLEPR